MRRDGRGQKSDPQGPQGPQDPQRIGMILTDRHQLILERLEHQRLNQRLNTLGRQRVRDQSRLHRPLYSFLAFFVS